MAADLVSQVLGDKPGVHVVEQVRHQDDQRPFPAPLLQLDERTVVPRLDQFGKDVMNAVNQPADPPPPSSSPAERRPGPGPRTRGARPGRPGSRPHARARAAALNAWSRGESPPPVSPAIIRPQSTRKIKRWLWLTWCAGRSACASARWLANPCAGARPPRCSRGAAQTRCRSRAGGNGGPRSCSGGRGGRASCSGRSVECRDRPGPR